jgi:pimeloyl-ACP methyl ester carboxylesterase
VNLREWGPPDGRPLVFWPGLDPFRGERLAEVGPVLGDGGVHVVELDPPWDLPEPDDYLPSRLADLVLETVPFERYVFMGHSWGGSIGVQLAADHPERLEGLVLLDAGYRNVELDVSRDRLVDAFEAEREREGQVLERSVARAAAWALHGVSREKQTATHERLHLPVLLLLARDAEGTVPNAEIDRLDAGHDLLEDAPAETARLVLEWLARLPRDG